MTQLDLEARQQALGHCKRDKRNYEKKKRNEYWDTGIVESRKKTMRSNGGASGSQSEESAVNATEVGTTKYENMTVKQLVQEINSRNLK